MRLVCERLAKGIHDGRKIYTLDGIYPYADLVIYPSTVEGY